MRVATDASLALRAAVVAHRDELNDILRRYGATDARLFGSVARSDATPSSDCDVLVDLSPAGGDELHRIAGIGEEFSQVLGVRVDVVTPGLLRTAGSTSALGAANEAGLGSRIAELFADLDWPGVERRTDVARVVSFSDSPHGANAS